MGAGAPGLSALPALDTTFGKLSTFWRVARDGARDGIEPAMPVLSVSNLTKAFGDTTVLAGVSFAIEPGEKIGLVGRNGVGKTTVLRLLAGLDHADGGAVSLRPGARAGYLAQIPDVSDGHTLWEEAAAAFAGLRQVERRLADAEARLASPEVHGDDARLASALDEYGRLRDRFETTGGFTYEAEIRRTLAGLGFEEEQFRQPLASMSGGQRSRAALARLLLSGPDMLLLDEPTNHLDLDALEWLQGFLVQSRGALLLVSHDRYLLDAVTSRTLELDDGRIEDYPGNYSYYATERVARRARQQELFERQQEEVEGLKDYIRRNHASGGQNARQAKSREKRLAKIQPIAAPKHARTLSFRLDAPRRGPQLVLRARNVTKRFDDARGAAPRLVRDPSGRESRDDRPERHGQDDDPADRGRARARRRRGPWSSVRACGSGYFAQHAEEALDLDRTVLDEVLGSRPLSPEQVRTLLGRFLFSGETAYKRIGQLSGGERRRVALAKLVLDRPDVLLLDEPTTHLDLPSLEALEGALRAFPGAIAARLPRPLPARPRRLASAGARRRDGRGGRRAVPCLPRGARGARRRTQPDVRERRPAPRPAAPPAAARPTPPSDRERAETRSAGSRGAAPNASELVARIAALETEQTDLSRLMGDPELYRDADRARRTVERYEEVCAALEALYGELEGVEEQAGA